MPRVCFPGGETLLRLLLLLLVVAGLTARFSGLSAESFWFDELRSLGQSDPGISQARLLEERILGDVHPPLYSLSLRAWRAAFGSSESAVRALSALLSAAAVPVGAILAYRQFGGRTALALAALLACSFGGIRYGQEARAYAGLFLTATILTLLYTRAVRDLIRGVALPLHFYAGLVLTALVSCGLHYFGALLAFAALGLLVVRSFLARRERVGMLVSAALVVAGFAPWVFHHLSVMGYQVGGNFGLTNDPEFLREQALEFVRLLAGSGWGAATAAAALVVALAGNLRAASAARPAFELAAVMLVVALLVTLHTPVMTARNLIVLLPPVYLGLALLLLPDSAGRGRLCLANALAALILLGGLAGYTKPVKEDWRGSAAFVGRFLDANPRCEGQRLVVWGGVLDVPSYAFYLGEDRVRLEPTSWMRKSTRPRVARVVREEAARGCLAFWGAFIDLPFLAEMVIEMGLHPRELAVAPFQRAFVVSRRRVDPPQRSIPAPVLSEETSRSLSGGNGLPHHAPAGAPSRLRTATGRAYSFDLPRTAGPVRGRCRCPAGAAYFGRESGGTAADVEAWRIGMAEDLSTAIVELKREVISELVEGRLSAGDDPLAILDECRRGMTLVGERFQEGEYYLSELLISAELFKQAAGLLEPHLARVRDQRVRRSVVLCTMRGDIHDLGKSILATLLRAQAFEVHDLGVNVEPSLLVEKVRELQPEFVGFSSLITTSFESTKEAIDRLEEAGLREEMQILLGGGVTTPYLRDYLGADFQTLDAVAGVDYCLGAAKGRG